MSGDTLHNGVVTEVLPQGHYRVATNTSLVLCELSNGMKKNRQQVHQGTSVVVKVSGIDPSRGTIIRRIKD
jgi:translation initiation factor IF-1